MSPDRVDDDEWRQNLEASGEFGEAFKRWRDHGDLGDRDSGAGGKVKAPRCKSCGRVDAMFEHKWAGVFKKLRGRGWGVLGGLEEELEDVMEGVERGV